MCIIAIIMKWFHFTLLVLSRLPCMSSDVSSSLMCLPLILKHSWWWWCRLAGHLKPNLLDIMDGSYYWASRLLCLNTSGQYRTSLNCKWLPKVLFGCSSFHPQSKNMQLIGNSKLPLGMTANGRLFQTQKTMIWLCIIEVAILVPIHLPSWYRYRTVTDVKKLKLQNSRKKKLTRWKPLNF